MSHRRCSAECTVFAPGNLLPNVFQLSGQGAWFSEETQTPVDWHENYYPSGNKSGKTLSSILNLTIFQQNLFSACDPGTKSFPHLFFVIKQNKLIFIFKNEQVRKYKWTQLTINILATEAIIWAVGGPENQIHPLKLSYISLKCSLNPETLLSLTSSISCVHCIGNTFLTEPNS